MHTYMHTHTHMHAHIRTCIDACIEHVCAVRSTVKLDGGRDKDGVGEVAELPAAAAASAAETSASGPVAASRPAGRAGVTHVHVGVHV